MSKLLMSHGFSLPVKCVFDENGVPFQIDDSYGDLLIDGESTCEETNYELVAHAINSHDEHVQRINQLERELKAEREINDRLRVVETERATRNDELYEFVKFIVDSELPEVKYVNCGLTQKGLIVSEEVVERAKSLCEDHRDD